MSGLVGKTAGKRGEETRNGFLERKIRLEGETFFGMKEKAAALKKDY